MKLPFILKLLTVLAVLAFCSVGSAKADTYDLTLTPTIVGDVGGTGVLTVTGPVTDGLFGFSTTDTGANQLTDLSFTLSGLLLPPTTFDLSDATAGSNGVFLDGDLISIGFTGFAGSGDTTLTLDTGSLVYIFSDSGSPLLDSAGTISAVPDPPPTDTPEPSSLLLLGAGLVALGFVALRKQRLAVPGAPLA